MMMRESVRVRVRMRMAQVAKVLKVAKVRRMDGVDEVVTLLLFATVMLGSELGRKLHHLD